MIALWRLILPIGQKIILLRFKVWNFKMEEVALNLDNLSKQSFYLILIHIMKPVKIFKFFLDILLADFLL